MASKPKPQATPPGPELEEREKAVCYISTLLCPRAVPFFSKKIVLKAQDHFPVSMVEDLMEAGCGSAHRTGNV